MTPEAMREYYVVMRSFAGSSPGHLSALAIEAADPESAITGAIADWNHPAGVYVAHCYEDANAVARGHKPIAMWASNSARKLCEVTRGLPLYITRVEEGGISVDGEYHPLKDPKGGSFLPVEMAV